MTQKKPKAGTSKAEAAKRKALFVEHYISNGGNASDAAIKAGYSEKTARVKGAQLLADVNIASELDKRRAQVIAKAEESTELTIAGVLRELHSIVHADLRGAFKDDGSLLPPNEWPDHVARAISSVKVVQAGMGPNDLPLYTKEVKLWDKNSGIDKAMKHLGLYEKDNKQQPLSGNVVIEVVGVRPS